MALASEPLAQLPLLDGLEADEFFAVTGRFSREQYPAGTRIIEEGYGGLKLFLLVEGRVRIVRSMGAGQILINTLGPPQAFGEISFIDGGPASATVEAETDVVVLTILKEDFNELLEASPALGTKVYKNLLKVTCQRIRSTTNQVQDYFAINQALCENEHFRKFYKLLCL